jgi:hypothetical protein
MQVPVRTPGPGGVVAHGHRLQALDRHLHLPAARADPGGGLLREPADDLDGGAVLRGVVGGADVRVQGGGQRPGLRPVDDHLDEPHRPVIGAQPTARGSGVGVCAGHPRLVAIPGQRGELGHPSAAGGVAAGEPGALGRVVVIGSAPVGLHVVAGRRGRAGADLHSAAHCQRPPKMTNTPPLETAVGPAKRARTTAIGSMRAVSW